MAHFNKGFDQDYHFNSNPIFTLAHGILIQIFSIYLSKVLSIQVALLFSQSTQVKVEVVENVTTQVSLSLLKTLHK